VSCCRLRDVKVPCCIQEMGDDMRDPRYPLFLIRRSTLQCGLVVVLFICAAASIAQPLAQLPQDASGDHNARNTKPIHDQKATKEVSDKLEKAFDPKNAAYAGSSIKPAVDDQSVTLTGTVKDQGQHEMALQLARAYAGSRKIVDRLTIQP
jgi:osmotically-inducible protein OsmY